MTFARASVRDQHIKSRNCSLQEWKGPPPGLSEGQLHKLAKRSKRGTTEADEWFGIWNLVFPKGDASSSRKVPLVPHLTGNLELVVCAIRDYWSREGKQIIANFLEKKGLQRYEEPDEERNLAALYQTTLDDMIDQAVQKVGDYCNETSSTLGSLWSSLVAVARRWHF